MKHLYRKPSYFPALRATCARSFATTILVLCVAACSLNSSDGPVVRGVLPASLRASTHTADLQAQALTAAVTRVGAIRIVAGNMNINTIESVPVQPDGSFEVPFSTQNPGNQLLITMNEEAPTPLERSQGVIALVNDSGINLAGLPLDNTFNDVDLGQLNFNPATRESLSSLSTLQQSELFGLSSEELFQEVINTNGAKTVINQYSNVRPNGIGQFNAGQNVQFESPIAEILNQFGDHEYWIDTEYRRNQINFRMEIPDSDVDYDTVASGAMVLSLTPSFEVRDSSDSSAVFDPDNPIRYSGSASGSPLNGADRTVYGPGEGGPDGGGLYMSFEFFDDVQPGVWILEIEGGRQLAIADTGSFLTETPDGVFLYPLPALRMNVDQSGRVQSVDVSIFQYNAITGQYSTIPQSAWSETFDSLGVQIRFDPNDGEENEWFFDGDVQSNIVPTRALYYFIDEPGDASIPDGEYRLRFITVRYEIFGFGFEYRYFSPQYGSLIL